MKTKRPWRIASITILVTVLLCFAGFDQVQAQGTFISGGSGGVYRVKVVGNFYPLKQKDKVWSINTTTVNVKNKEWLFSIKRAIELTGEMDSFEILKNLRAAILTFRGPDNLIDPLLEPDIAGRRFAIQGTFYISTGILQVYSVTEVIKKKEKKE